MATKEQKTETTAKDISKKMADSAAFNANELQKVQIYTRQNAGYTFYEFILLGQRVSLDKALIDHLKDKKQLRQTITIEPYMQLYAIQNGKYCNLRLGITKDMREQLNNSAAEEATEDLPF